jgi:transposase
VGGLSDVLQTFLELLEGIDGEYRVALEATYAWEWLAELLEEAGYELHLAHPLRTKAIASARVKTDAVDARTLAYLLRADLLPEAYVAPRELRDLRDLLRHRVGGTTASGRSIGHRDLTQNIGQTPGWRSPGCARRSRTASTRC